MTVTTVFAANQENVKILEVPEAVRDTLVTGLAVNSASHLIKNPISGEVKRVGNQTECALL